MLRKPFDEALHPRGFGGKFGHGTGTKKVEPKKGRKYTAADVISGGAIKGSPPVAAQKASFWKFNAPSKGKGAKAIPPKAGVSKSKPTPSPRPKPPSPPAKAAGFTNPVRAAEPAHRAVVPEGARFKMLSVGRKPDGSMDYQERGKYADKVLVGWFAKHHDTQTLFRKNGRWDPARRAQQEQLIEDIWYAHAANVPNEGRAIFSGGLGGAGKGYALGKKGLNVDTDADWEHPGKRHEFFTINPDVVKAMMAQRGMIPLSEDPNLTPMELSPLAHEEASQIADELAQRAYRERKNVVWDFTMASEKSVVAKRLEPMRKAGYKQITAVFVDTTVENSKKQAAKRWQRGMDDFIGGKGDGGRFLPSAATKANEPAKDSKFLSKNREVFEATKSQFDGHVIYQNLGETLPDGRPKPPEKIADVGLSPGGKGQAPRVRKSADLSIDEMHQTLSDNFAKAEPWMKQTGADWYPASREWVDYAVAGTDYTPEQGAAIVAAMSPNTPWDRNLVLALNYIKGRPLGKDDGSGTLTDNVERADRVRDGVDFGGNSVDNPLDSLPGENKEGAYKISNFYRNLTGNQEAVTVDRWAVRAALGVDDKTAEKMLKWKGTYAKVADAYRKAAKDAGVTPATMQAVIWGQVRGSFD